MFRPKTRNKKVLGAMRARQQARLESETVRQVGKFARVARQAVQSKTVQLQQLVNTKVRKGRKALQDSIREHNDAYTHLAGTWGPSARNRRNRELKQARALEKSMTPREREIYKREQMREIEYRKSMAEGMRKRFGMKFKVGKNTLGYMPGAEDRWAVARTGRRR